MPGQTGFQQAFIQVDGVIDVDNAYNPTVLIGIHLRYFHFPGCQQILRKLRGHPAVGLAPFGAIDTVQPDTLLLAIDQEGERIAIGHPDDLSRKIMRANTGGSKE